MATECADFAEFHGELRSVAVDMLAKDSVVDWAGIVAAGWSGLEVSDEHGGAGATFVEAAVICEELGRAAAATSHLGGAVLAVGALKAVQPSNTRDRLLVDVASGGPRMAVALGDFTIAADRLSGRAEFVPDADGAAQLLAVTPAGVVVVDAEAVTVTPQPVIDDTRRLATVTADNSPVGEVLPFDGDPDTQEAALWDRAAVAIACDSLGLSEAMLSATVDYVKMRHQFGRPIGSFQAVKHACADMMVSIAVSRRLVDAAVQAVAGELPDRGTAAAMAKSHATAAGVHIAGKAMQLHGGIGYTWESGLHVYLKRATLNRSFYGSPAAHRRRLAQRYLQR